MTAELAVPKETVPGGQVEAVRKVRRRLLKFGSRKSGRSMPFMPSILHEFDAVTLNSGNTRLTSKHEQSTAWTRATQ